MFHLLFRVGGKSLGLDRRFCYCNNNICVLLRLSGELINNKRLSVFIISILSLICYQFPTLFPPFPNPSHLHFFWNQALHVSKASVMQALDCLWGWCSSVHTNTRHGPKQRDRINQNPGEAGLMISWLKPTKSGSPTHLGLGVWSKCGYGLERKEERKEGRDVGRDVGLKVLCFAKACERGFGGAFVLNLFLQATRVGPPTHYEVLYMHPTKFGYPLLLDP
jgi:hypothetical protein